MEFLVRLKDKINIQVFCLNPVHKGNHMDRVFYEDDTFNAPCPDCGSEDWLYRKNNAITKKGHFITFKPDGWSWGTNERKHYGIIRIDCTYAQAKEWCEGIKNEQAEADAKNYMEQADIRGKIVINIVKVSVPTPITELERLLLVIAMKEALESDGQYVTLIDNMRQAENRAQIDYRPNKNTFDFEKVLSVSELKNWNDKRVFNKVIEQAAINMKVL